MGRPWWPRWRGRPPTGLRAGGRQREETRQSQSARQWDRTSPAVADSNVPPTWRRLALRVTIKIRGALWTCKYDYQTEMVSKEWQQKKSRPECVLAACVRRVALRPNTTRLGTSASSSCSPCGLRPPHASRSPEWLPVWDGSRLPLLSPPHHPASGVRLPTSSSSNPSPVVPPAVVSGPSYPPSARPFSLSPTPHFPSPVLRSAPPLPPRRTLPFWIFPLALFFSTGGRRHPLPSRPPP